MPTTLPPGSNNLSSPAMVGDNQSIQAPNATPMGLEEVKPRPTIGTVHQDEAHTVLARYYGNESWTPQEEQDLLRRLDKKLITLLVVTYGLQYYDKAMLAQAVSRWKADSLQTHS
jgi:hypothetical protein